MKKLIISFLILNIFHVVAQKDYRATLDVFGYTRQINISKDSTFYLASRAGLYYASAGFNKTWRYELYNSDDHIFNFKSFTSASFFNKDTGFVSGKIYDLDDKAYNIIWTNNGGKTWERLNILDSNDQIRGSYYDLNGNAWVHSSDLIFYSNDYGKTWKKTNKIDHNSKTLINTIYFENSKRGVVGCFNNTIYFTSNNCFSWKCISSPFDQNKLNFSKKDKDLSIKKIQILGNNIIVNQKNRIFISKLDTIQWKELNTIIDFSVDQKLNKIYTISKDLQVQLLDTNFRVCWTAPKKLDYLPNCINTFNGTLYTWKHIYFTKINQKEFCNTIMYTLDHPISHPDITSKADKIIWGATTNNIFQSDDSGNTWFRLKILNFNIGSIYAINDTEAIISDSCNKNHYKVDIKSDTVRLSKYSLINPFSDFLNDKLIEISFEFGVKGCRYISLDKIIYKQRNNSKFVVSKIEQKGFNDVKLKYKNKFHSGLAIDLLQKINSNPFSKVKLVDFNINERDISEYLSKIDTLETEYQKGKNTYYYYNWATRYYIQSDTVDFDFLKNVKEKLYTIDENVLNEILGREYGSYCTRTQWVKIIFKNKMGKEISISNKDDQINAWYLPWIVNYNGLQFPINNIEVTKFIESNTPKSFISSKDKNKLLIFQIMSSYLHPPH